MTNHFDGGGPITGVDRSQRLSATGEKMNHFLGHRNNNKVYEFDMC